MTETSPLQLIIPVYNDWASLMVVLGEVDQLMAHANERLEVTCVDDCSNIEAPAALAATSFRAFTRITVIRLQRNLGHQRAIAVGLCHVHLRSPSSGTIIMDADGEDRPCDVPRLLDAFRKSGGHRAIFAQRIKRSEGLFFSICYAMYRLMHRLFTGIPVQIGNFSVLPPEGVRRLVVSSEIWNHYAAAVVQARLPMEMVPAPRGKRVSGESHMNFVSLVAHGLSAMSVFSDRIGTRFLVAAGVMATLLVASLLLMITLLLFTSIPVSPWTIAAPALMLIVPIGIALFALGFIFMVQHSRAASSFIPIRDSGLFIGATAEFDAYHESTKLPGTRA